MRPTPRPGPNGQTIKESAPPVEEAVAWERVAEEMQEATASANTAPTDARRISRSSALRPSIQAYRARERRRLMLVMGIVAAVAIFALGVVLFLALRGDNGKSGSGKSGLQPGTIFVSFKGKEGAVSSLGEAFRKAKQGDHIVVSDGPIVEEVKYIAGNIGLPKNLTLEPEPGAPVPVEWRLRSNIKDAPFLLTISHVDGLTLRGFTFDGGDRVKDLLTITGICPGLTIEDIKLKNFLHAGVAITNCQGTAERPVTIRRVHFALSKPADFGFVFDINQQIKAISVNQHIRISNVTLDAGMKFSKGLALPIQPGFIDKTDVLPQ
jgi:hypothetical protein